MKLPGPPGGKRYLDEIVISIKGKKHCLWRTVDANCEVLVILIQSRLNTSAINRFFRKMFRCWGQPRVLIIDKFSFDFAVKAEIAREIEHRQHKGVSSRAEASLLVHPSTR